MTLTIDVERYEDGYMAVLHHEPNGIYGTGDTPDNAIAALLDEWRYWLTRQDRSFIAEGALP